MSSTIKKPIFNPYYNPALSSTPSNCAYNSLNPTLLYRINLKKAHEHQIKVTQRIQYGPLPKKYPPTYYETGYNHIFNDPDVTITYV